MIQFTSVDTLVGSVVALDVVAGSFFPHEIEKPITPNSKVATKTALMRAFIRRLLS